MDSSKAKTEIKLENGRILIVDDEEIVHLTLKRLLEPEGYAIDSAYGGKEALDRLATGYDLLILDIRMPDIDGIDVLREVRRREIDIEVVILTGFATIESATQAMNYGARSYIMKPIENVPEFRNSVREGVHMARLAHENKRFYEDFISDQAYSFVIDSKSYQMPGLREEIREIFRRLIEVIRDAVVFVDFDGRIKFTNLNFTQMIGESYQNLLGKEFELYIEKEDRDKIVDVFTRLASGHVAVSIRTRLKTNFGRILFVTISASHMYYKMEYRGIVMLISNVTETDAVRRKAELLANLVENAQYDMMFVVRPDGQIIECNSLARSSFGYTQSEILKLNIMSLLKSETDDRWERIVDFIEQDLRRRREIMAITKDGKEFPIELSVSRPAIKPNEWEGALALLITLRDITERKRAEEALKSSETRLRTIIENTADSILVTDRNGIVLFINPSAESLFYRKEEELIGEIFGFPIETGETIELDIPYKDKGPIVVEMRVVEIEWEGESAHLLSLRDVTDRKRYEESLVKTTEELKRLDQIKSDFISTASHELRTPLASIKNAVDIILNKKTGEITDAQEKFLSMAQRNVNRLSALINDLLDISRIESGKIQLNYTEVDIKNIIENVINTFRSLANEKSISLKMNLASDLPPIYVDVSRLEQVLINLVNNAIKFTPDRGTIAVDVHQVDGVSDMSEGLEGFLELAVTDTGIGISEEHVRHLFEKFYQVEPSLSVKRQPGTGLGLVISKGLVKALGGKIQCKSKEGGGSTFSFTLPIIATEKRFYYMLENELAKAKQHHLPLSVLIIKLKDFAHVKEVYGIKECERVLEIVKEKIEKKGIKVTDTINVSRYNSEIIALIIMPDAICSGAQIVQERITPCITGIEIAAGESKYSCSFISGVATYPDDGISAEELLDFAMERLEKKG